MFYPSFDVQLYVFGCSTTILWIRKHKFCMYIKSNGCNAKTIMDVKM